MRASTRVRAGAGDESRTRHAPSAVPRARADRAAPATAGLAPAAVVHLQRAAGNAAVADLLAVQRTPGGGSGGGAPPTVVQETPEALGARLGAASKGMPSRFDFIVAGINNARLSAPDALRAAASATREIGLRLFSETVGADVVLCSVQPGTGKPVLIVRPDGMVVRGTADIALASPPSLEHPMSVTNVRANAAPTAAAPPPAAPPAPAERPAAKPPAPEGPVAPPTPGTAPKAETVPSGGAGTGPTATGVGVEVSRLRTAGRFLARAAPGLLLQALLMAVFPPRVHVHNDGYDTLSSQKIAPALQRALTQQAAAVDALAAGGPGRSVWATVTVESEYRVQATSGGDLHLSLHDLRFVDMTVTDEYVLVEGPKFQVGAGASASKRVTFSVPLLGPATRADQTAIQSFRTVRAGLTSSAYKVRLSAMLAMARLADAEPSLRNQLVRDLRPLLADDESVVRKVAARLLDRLGAGR